MRTVALRWNQQRPLASLAGAAELAAHGVRLSYLTVRRLPVVGEVLRQRVIAVGEHLLAGHIDLARDELRTLMMQMVSSALDKVDLTPLIRDRIDVNELVDLIDMDAVVTRVDVVPVLERVEINDVVSRLDVNHVVSRLDINAVVDRLDLDAVVARIDVNELVARLDVDSIISRIDVAGLVAVIRDQVSLPALIRNSARNAVSDGRVNRRSGVDQVAPAGPRQRSRPRRFDP